MFKKIRKFSIYVLLFAMPLGAVSFLSSLNFEPVNFATSAPDYLPEGSEANFYFDQVEEKYTVGDLVTANLFVSSRVNLNALGGAIIFPPDKLEVVSLSPNEECITDVWSRQPKFDNQTGLISFAGATLAKNGFVGTHGHLLKIVLRVKEAGAAVLYFDDSKILAADGKGTNLKIGTRSLSLSLAKKVTKADLTDDGKTDLQDLAVLVSRWGDTGNTQFDLNGDGKIDLADVSILIGFIIGK